MDKLITVFFVILIGIIVNASKKSKKGTTQKNTIQKNTTSNSYATGVKKESSSNRSTQTTYQNNNFMKTAIANETNVSTDASKGGQSTTDYLRVKAEQENKNNLEENNRNEKNRQKKEGYVKTAGRLLLGDPVPNGARKIKCSYCGAENLVPLHDHSPYHCYFCRESLKM